MFSGCKGILMIFIFYGEKINVSTVGAEFKSAPADREIINQ
jgi:hypothetical protein